MAEDDIQDDGRADERRDRVQRQQSSLSRQHAEQVAQQGGRAANQQADGQQGVVVGGAEQQPGDVGDGQADERDGTAEGGGDRGQRAGDEQQPMARATDIDPEVAGIPGTQQQGVEGLDEQQRSGQSGEDEQREGGQLAQRNAPEVP